MAPRITNAVLAERISNFQHDFSEFKDDFKENIVPEIKANSQFRVEQKAKGRLLKVLVGSGWVTTIALAIIGFMT